MKAYTVTMYVHVDDEEQLRLAAEARAVEDGLSMESWRDMRQGTGGDLVMLLDPGSLPGCSIEQSDAEHEALFSDDDEDSDDDDDEE